jgi:glycerophosphoryl diester phosphodiesterase
MKKNVLAISILMVAVSCSGPQQSISSTKFAANPVIAHRGAWKKNKLPENSIAALKEAISLGCTGSEFDMWMTADDSIVINHDPHYNKLTIEKTSYADLLPFKLSNGEKIPTLREYLLAGLENNKQTLLVLEIKPSTISVDRGRIVAEKVVKLVHELNATSMSAYISFDYEILKKIIEVDPKATTQYLKGDVAPGQLNKDKISGLDYHYSVFEKQPTWIDEAKKHKLALNAWTVNDAKTMNLLLDKGFQYITTNEPELLFDIVRDRSKN